MAYIFNSTLVNTNDTKIEILTLELFIIIVYMKTVVYESYYLFNV